MKHLTSVAVVIIGTLSFSLTTPVHTAQLPEVKEKKMQLGIGCAFSDYAALPQASDDESIASFRYTHDSTTLGNGIYTLHFKNFHLPDTDYVVLNGNGNDASKGTNDGGRVVFHGRNATGSFYASPVVGDGFVLQLYKKKQSVPTSTSTSMGDACFGFEVDSFMFASKNDESFDTLTSQLKMIVSSPEASTDTDTETESTHLHRNTGKERILRLNGTINESLCGDDESQEAVCFRDSNPNIYQTSQGVARLVISKNNNMNIAYCTGFLLGCEGHLITNQHCIRHWLDALNTIIEFQAEATTCGESCMTRGSCPGKIVLKAPALVTVSTDLDYSLVKLNDPFPAALAQRLGYLQMRASGAIMGEDIFIPQYPLGWGMRIATTASQRIARVESLDADSCGKEDIGYYIDTQEGSSGAPVVAMSDHTVVALHHCGGCLNAGVKVQRILLDLQSRGLLPRCAIR